MERQYSALNNDMQHLRDKLRMREQHLSSLGQDLNAQGVIRDFYSYSLLFTSLLNGTSQTGNINIQADSDFVVQKQTYFVAIDGGSDDEQNRIIPDATVLIVDTGSGRQLSDKSIPISTVFGTGQLPFILPTPKLFLARSTINMSVNNSGSIDYDTLTLVLTGYKVFRGVRTA